jgi:hypothetical protein
MANKYLKFEYWNTCDLGNVYYQGGHHFWFYLDGDVLEPFHEDTEDGQENGEGDFVPTYRRQMKRYRIKSSLIPEHLIDAIQRMKLHDNIELTFKTGEVEQIYNLDVEPEWQFEKYCWQGTVTLTFDMDEKVVLGACCDNLTVEGSSETPYYDIAVPGVYYVKNGGNDALDGLTDATAWETLTKVHNTAFTPGNIINFKRGDTFRGSIYKNGENGSSGNYITYRDYYTGAKPKILGSKDLSATGDWTNDAGSIWKTTATLGINQNDISNLIFNYEDSCGIKKNSKVGCIAQGQFFYNTADNLVYLYSIGNPATYYVHIEAAGHHDINQGIFKWINSSYVTVQNLDVRYSSAAGIEFQTSTHSIIEHNDLSYIGGEWLTDGSDLERLGNGISVVLACDDIVIRYNKVSQCYDSGISPQGWGVGFTQSNIEMYYNIISNCWISYEFFSHTGMTFNNINFYNNTCVNAGYCWCYGQRHEEIYSCHFMSWELVGTAMGCNIKNNIFSIARTSCMRIGSNPEKLNIDYNLYDIDVILFHISGVGDYMTLATWQAAYPQDVHSVSGDPLFMSFTDFHLQPGSPAINEGVNVGLTEDYDGEVVSDPPEIGAYEY